MGRLIWKELREHLKWALLLMAGMGLAMAFVLSQEKSQGYRHEGIAICSDTFLLVTTIGCAVAGLLLGLLQVALEARRDHWAFLVHRPTSRTTIWLGKVMAGVLLYLCAMGIPLLVASWWAATPGNIAAPFDWRMALPALADLLDGIVFYFAGMLTGLRTARWYGSRALGLAAAVLCAWGALQAPEFWIALIIFAVFCGALALAAWGSFLTAGSWDAQPRLAKVGLGLSLSLGIYTTVTLAAFLVLAIAADDFRRWWTVHYITRDGEILRVTTDYATVTDIRDLNGNAVDKYAAEKYQHLDNLWQQVALSAPLRGPLMNVSYRESERYFTWLNFTTDLHWYYAHADGLILAYSHRRNELVGSLGPEGFLPPPAARADRFPGEWIRRWRPLPILAFTGAVYSANLTDRTVTKLIEAGAGEKVHGAYLASSYSQERDIPFLLAVCLDNRLALVSKDGKQVLTIDLAYDPQQYPQVSAVLLPKQERLFVWHKPSWWLPGDARRHHSEHIVEYDLTGTERARHDLPVIVPEQTSSWYERTPALFMPLGAFAILLGGQALLGEVRSTTGGPPFVFPMNDLIVFVVPALIAAVVCVLATLLIARRYAFSTRRLNCWAVIAFLLGPVGLLLLWALSDWPARVPCHACGRQRVVTQAQCPRCAAEFARAPLDGTEILEPSPA